MPQPAIFRRTVNIHIGRKLIGKTRDEVLAEVLKLFRIFKVLAVQQSYDVIRVTFGCEEEAAEVARSQQVKLFEQ